MIYHFSDRVWNSNSYQITLDIRHISDRHMSVAVNIGGSFAKGIGNTDTNQRALDPRRVTSCDIAVAVSVSVSVNVPASAPYVWPCQVNVAPWHSVCVSFTS